MLADDVVMAPPLLDEHLSLPHRVEDLAIDALNSELAIDQIAILHQVLWSGKEGERLNQLLRSPFGCRTFGHTEMNNSPPVVYQHDENE